MSGGAAGRGRVRGRPTGRGRYGRNAVVQGAAAELFKMWAVTVRARAAPLGARIVLCLHDELLVHVPEDRAERRRRNWSATAWPRPPGAGRRGGPVRFIADITIVRSWADAKG